MALDLYALVQTITDAHEDEDERRRVLLKEARFNVDLHDKIMWEGAGQLLRSFFTSNRRLDPKPDYQRKPVVVGAAGGDASKYDAGQEATAKRRNFAAREFWNTYTLFGHKRLSAATMADLRASAEAHESQSRGHERAAGFERDLLNRMITAKAKADTKVGDFFHGNDAIVAIFKEHEVKGKRAHVA